MPYVKRNGVGVYEEPNPSEIMIKAFNGYIRLLESDLDTRPKEVKQVDIDMAKKWIEEEKV